MSSIAGFAQTVATQELQSLTALGAGPGIVTGPYEGLGVAGAAGASGGGGAGGAGASGAAANAGGAGGGSASSSDGPGASNGEAPTDTETPTEPGTVNYQGHTVSDEQVRNRLERIAELSGRDVNVTSGDRDFVPPGGSRTSHHLDHRAADFHVEGWTDQQTYDFIRDHHAQIFDDGNRYQVIHHGAHTSTGGPHVHMGRYPSGAGTNYSHEGRSPGSGGTHTPDPLPP